MHTRFSGSRIRLLLLMTFLFTAGCTPAHHTATVPPVTLSTSTPGAPMPAGSDPSSPGETVGGEEQQTDPVASCRQALTSLNRINAARGIPLKRQFDGLVNAASEYSAIRAETAGDIRQTVDAMYEFKTARLCADIRKALLDSLVERGGK